MLQTLRKNIINWYPFKEDSTILQIGKDDREITEVLNEKAKKVTAIEIDEIKNLKIEEQFDYITLLSGEDKEKINILEYVVKFLKQNGTILIVCDNKFGMRYWTGYKDKEEEYNTITSNTSKTVSKKQIEEKIKKINLKNVKYYYPLPNYEMANIIYTDEILPNKDSISRDLFIYKENLNFDERQAYLQIVKEDKTLFSLFANSYLIEITNGEIENHIKYVCFGNSRKPKYRLKTVIENNVYKTAIDEKSNEHIKLIEKNIDLMNQIGLKTLDSYDNQTIISRYVDDYNTLDKVLMDLCIKQGKKAVFDLMDKFINELINKLCLNENYLDNVFSKHNINVPIDILSQMKFIKHGLWDATFQNCFYIDGEFYLYDQEWYEENIPIEFIIYRAITYLYEIQEYIDIQEMYQHFNLQEKIQYFEILEQKLQEEIRESSYWKEHAESVGYINHYKKECAELYRIKKEIEEKMTQIVAQSEQEKIESQKEKEKLKEEEISLIKEKEKLNSEIETLKQNINTIVNSKSWKITKPLRKIREKL